MFAGRKLFNVITAFCLCMYLLAVAGFDVHVCRDNGRIYIEPLYAGISCEDIHPSSPCHHHGHECCEDEEDCCTDEIAVLSITGDGSDCAVSVPQSPSAGIVILAETAAPRLLQGSFNPWILRSPPDTGPDVLSICCILRV